MLLGAFVVATFGVAWAEPVEVDCVDFTNGPHLDEATVRNVLHRARPCGEPARRWRGWDPGLNPRQLPELRDVLLAAPPSDATREP